MLLKQKHALPSTAKAWSTLHARSCPYLRRTRSWWWIKSQPAGETTYAFPFSPTMQKRQLEVANSEEIWGQPLLRAACWLWCELLMQLTCHPARWPIHSAPVRISSRHQKFSIPTWAILVLLAFTSSPCFRFLFAIPLKASIALIFLPQEKIKEKKKKKDVCKISFIMIFCIGRGLFVFV